MIGEIDRLDKLVLDLLEFDAQELNQGKFDSSELLKQTAQKCEIILREQGSRLCLRCEANLAYVCANRRGVEQIMTNFLSNAIKNTPANGAIILKSENEQDLVIISVFNEGHPIEENELVRIWDQFYRSDQSRTRRTGGTGLGPVICRGILKKHESSCGAENIEGGVRFFFRLKSSK